MAKKTESAQTTVRRIRRKTRKKYNPEDKIRIVIEGLRGEMSVAELCRKEGISQSLYYKWSKEFLNAIGDLVAEDKTRSVENLANLRVNTLRSFVMHCSPEGAIGGSLVYTESMSWP